MPRKTPAKPVEPLSNAAAIAVMIKTLKRLGRLEDVDAALVTGAETLARAVDAEPANASLWREYRAFETRLRLTGVGVDDALEQALAALRSPVGDSTV